MSERKFYVQRPDGSPLGTLDAPDANAAQSMATAMWGLSAYVFPASHVGWAERILGDWKQQIADGAA